MAKEKSKSKKNQKTSQNQKPLISFDYAIKFLLKHKKDYGIVEGFISDLLKAIGYPPVKIINSLDPESLAEEPKFKRSLADLIVEDSDHQKYIVEIERSLDVDFIHKACFNTSRLIVDSLPKGDEYANIKKVFHISLLYFPIGETGPIYHGNNGIYELETREPLVYPKEDVETKVITDAAKILPEYLFISVPRFQDQLLREIDDWLYVMKYDKVPKEFHSKYMKQVEERLSMLTMSDKELRAYHNYRKKLLKDSSEWRTAITMGRAEGRAEGRVEGKAEGLAEGMEKGIEKGIEKGMEQGIEKNKIETARNMLHEGLDIAMIQKVTGLSLEVIQDIQTNPT